MRTLIYGRLVSQACGFLLFLHSGHLPGMTRTRNGPTVETRLRRMRCTNLEGWEMGSMYRQLSSLGEAWSTGLRAARTHITT